jgi:DNA-binding NtrC family response regulator
MKILIAEDEADIWRPYKIALEDRNHEVVITENGAECLKIYTEEILKQSNTRSSSLSSSGERTKIKEDDDDNNNNTGLDDTSSSSTSFSSSHPSFMFDSLQYSPFDAVILDYRMPGKDGMEVAKEILELNPNQRIIFASAYVKETLEDSVKELKRVVELMQKPFDADTLVDAIEDKEVQEGLKKLMTNLRQTSTTSANDKDFEPSLEQIRDLFEGLRKIQKGRTF